MLHDALVGSFSFKVVCVFFAAVGIYGDELSLAGRLEVIKIEPQGAAVQFIQGSQPFLGIQPGVANHLADSLPVFLFDMGIVVLFVRTTSCEGNLLSLTVAHEVLVDVLAAVV